MDTQGGLWCCQNGHAFESLIDARRLIHIGHARNCVIPPDEDCVQAVRLVRIVVGPSIEVAWYNHQWLELHWLVSFDVSFPQVFHVCHWDEKFALV
jgi:hypothetical protein